MNPEILRYRVNAPGSFVFCCAAEWNGFGEPRIGSYKKICSCCDYCFHYASQFQTMYTLLSKFKSNGGTVEVISPRKIVVNLPSTIIPLQTALYRENIPIELLKIVESYYGSHGSAEAILYPMITSMIYKLVTSDKKDYKYITASGEKWDLPFKDLSESLFTRTLYTDFGFVIESYDSNNPRIHKVYPDIFYHMYKLANKLNASYIPPVIDID